MARLTDDDPQRRVTTPTSETRTRERRVVVTEVGRRALIHQLEEIAREVDESDPLTILG